MISLFSNLPPWLAVVLISMSPMLESKIAIQFGVASQISGESAFSAMTSCLLAFVGSVFATIIIVFVARFVKLKTTGMIHDRFVSVVEEKYNKHFSKLSRKKSVFKKCLFLCLFVAIPLPLTGVYSGGLIAGFSNLKIWQSVASIIVGALISCLVVTVMCVFAKDYVDLLLLVSLVIVAVVVLGNVLFYIVKNKLSQKKEKR